MPAVFILTVVMILDIRLWKTFPIEKAILMICYGFVPAILFAYICNLRFDAFLKAETCTALSALMLYFANFVANRLFGPSDNNYKVDFYNWEECINGNINIICLFSFLLIAATFIGIGIYRMRKLNK